uniref:Uncharacterized protein n=1 Tax=Podoviridae sp. ctG4L18 TaxID=2825234 RepID=A0A8S5UPL5_9CAUD|nr:MAG TPA: hypothetical protein [Podoviridae sp. ctG4L18]DAO74374.1 MAG TPA: hypothetical protein [Bacteriophage sp.]
MLYIIHNRLRDTTFTILDIFSLTIESMKA